MVAVRRRPDERLGLELRQRGGLHVGVAARRHHEHSEAALPRLSRTPSSAMAVHGVGPEFVSQGKPTAVAVVAEAVFLL